MPEVISRRAQRVVPLPSTDLDQLRHRVRALAENRPAVYQMFDATGRVLYIGKAKRLRTRLLTYFRASYPDDKAARILYAASEIRWDYVPSEFAAYLGELRQIRKFRPYFNHKGNYTRRSVLIKIAGGPAPRVYGGGTVAREDIRCYGPFQSMGRMQEAVRTLNDLLGLRDCPPPMPVVFAGQEDLFAEPRQAGCMRHQFGFCSGPCAGFVAERDYRRRVDTAMAFLEGRTLQPIDRVVVAMQEAAGNAQFELAARWRSKFEQLEWLLAATSRARTAIDLLTFVYRDTGDFGDDRVYILRRGVVRASFPYPATPIEHEAFRGVMAQEISQPPPLTGPLPLDSLDEVLLMMAWFRAHPEALRRTTPYEQWM
ncbi:MAG: nuclease [Gemmatimonadales bacterium]|nr:nuclease [Gemmatimonadales bacterium]